MLPIKKLINAEDIERRVHDLCAEIYPQLQTELVVISLLKGGFIFAADFIRELSKYHGFFKIGFATITKKKVQFNCCVENKQVLLLDDILESGRTIQFVKKKLRKAGAKNVVACTLLTRNANIVQIENIFTGFGVDKRVVFGYGLDSSEQFRGLPYIGTSDSNKGIVISSEKGPMPKIKKVKNTKKGLKKFKKLFGVPCTPNVAIQTVDQTQRP